MRRLRLPLSSALYAMNETAAPTAKILFRVPNENDADDVETLWATHIEGDNYRVENSPFYAYGVSWKDIVLAPYNENESFPTFKSVISKSGNKTIRLFFEVPVEEGNQSSLVLKNILELGCDYEGANKKYICVNIPPNIELQSVCNFLTQQKVTWEHADPTYESLYS
jgi:hypothetical protein